MSRLISRQKYIPNGFKFYDPHLRWTAPANASFQVICDQLRNARMANPGVTKANNLTTDPAQIAEELDAYNAAICEQHGWLDYVGGSGASVPFPQPPSRSLPQRAGALAAGAAVVVEWLASGAEAVPIAQSTSRAEVCSKCPKNMKGDWTRFFEQKASDAIRAQLNRKRELKLETPFDDQLGVCDACSCPMKLKVHLKFEAFYPKMLLAAKDALDPLCWIRRESAEALK